MRVYGHRGARGHAPENTLAGIDAAVRLGARWVEVDVQLCAGVPVLLHDRTLDRTTSGHGPIAACTLEMLGLLDAGGGQRVPTLRDALDHLWTATAGDCGINVELKTEAGASAVADDLHQAMTTGPWRAEQLLVSSFDHHELARMRDLLPTVPRAALYAGVPLDYAAAATELGAVAVHVSTEFMPPAFVSDARARSLAIAVYTVNDTDALASLQAMGIDGVFTDFPERALMSGGTAPNDNGAGLTDGRDAR